MILRINLNTAAMNSHRNLANTDNAMSRTMERLSSGYRINRAADDPAGLVISEKLRAQVSGLQTSIANSNDAINMVRTAEAALAEVHSLLHTMRDLAVHASNTGANDDASIAADQSQINSSIQSINRIASTTQFGSRFLLNGQAGALATVEDNVHISGATPKSNTPAGYVSVQVTQVATKAQMDTSQTYASSNATVANAGNISVNGQTIQVLATDKVSDVLAKINALRSLTGVSARWDGDHVELNQEKYGSDQFIAYTESAQILNGGISHVQKGQDAVATITYEGTGATEVFNAGSGLRLKGATSGMIINLTEAGNAVGNYTNALFVNSGKLQFQIGPNVGQSIELSLPSVAASELGKTATGLTNPNWTVADIDVSTAEGAKDAIRLLDAAISEISLIRSDLGSFQKNTLESNINSLGIARENLAASESMIRDADMAAEMVRFTRDQILLQSGTAMLTQANLAPQTLLSLLRGG